MAITLSICNGFSKFLHAEREINFQQNTYNISHYTFSMLPHYFAKVRSSSFGIYGRKYQRKCNMHWFLSIPT